MVLVYILSQNGSEVCFLLLHWQCGCNGKFKTSYSVYTKSYSVYTKKAREGSLRLSSTEALAEFTE